MDPVESLARCPDLAVAQSHTLEDLARDIVLGDYAAGEVVFDQDDPPRHAYLIESGSFRVTSATSDGSARFLVDMHEGELLGEMSAVVQCPRSATATALEAGRAWEIPEASLRAALESDPRLAYTMLKRVTMDEDSEAAARVGPTPEQELASQILELYERGPAEPIDIDIADLALRMGRGRWTSSSRSGA
jgi:CRP-like cAMP-binding protein